MTQVVNETQKSAREAHLSHHKAINQIDADINL